MEEKKEGSGHVYHNGHTHHKEKYHKKTILNKLNLKNIFVWLILMLVILAIINISLTFNLTSKLKKSIEASKEALRPAKIELTVIKNSKCSDCFDTLPIISNIKNTKVNITKESVLEFDSKEGKEIVSKYKIEKVPTVIITGEIDKTDVQWLEKIENALLLTNTPPPYTNTATGKIEGRVVLYNLKDSSCEKCSDLSSLVSQIRNAGVKVSEEKIILPSSEEGKELAKKYNIDFAPTIILSKDAGLYSIIQEAWPRIGSKESDGSYVLRLVNPPFINLTTGKLRGIVNIIYLTDKSCEECYDVMLHREILTSPSFALKLDKEETIDVSDAKGKELIAKYNITLVPTIILSGEVSVYPSIQILKNFFSVEKDAYVFRNLNSVGTYKDLTTKQIVKPQQAEEQ